MQCRFKIRLFALLCLLAGRAVFAMPIVAASPDTPSQKALAGRPVDTGVLRYMPSAQVGAVSGWKSRLQPYYTTVKKSQNVYLNFCAELLVRSGLPQELKLICLIESHMNPEALSEDGALGIWQLMPAVALENGLSATPFDERKDIYKSSQVAVRVILSLHKKFSDPLLVVAAYNCGAGRVKNTLQEAGANSYWPIHSRLPAETQNHVLKYLAALSIFYNIPLPAVVKLPAEILTEATPTFGSPVENKKDGLLTIQITASYRAKSIQQYTGISPELFAQLNPLMQSTLAAHGEYGLRLPAEAMQLFLLNKSLILKSSLRADN